MTQFKLEILDHQTNKGLFQYYDMDSDGESELMLVGYNRYEDNSFPFVRINYGVNSKPDVVEQINFANPKLTYMASTMIADYNNNKLHEHYTFTFKDSVLYLEAFEYQKNTADINFFLYKEIAPVNTYKGEYDLNIVQECSFRDLNHDGFKECVFILQGLYTAEPRGIYAYDIRNDSLWHSPSGSIQLMRMQIAEHNKKTYFGAYTMSVHNCNEPLPKYHDHCGWSVLFDEHLSFVFPPDSNKHGYPFKVQGFPIIYNDSIHLLTFYEVPKNSRDSTKIRLFNSSGKVVMEMNLGISGRLSYNDFKPYEKSVVFGLPNKNEAWKCQIQDKISIEKIEIDIAKTYNNIQLYPALLNGEQFFIGFNIDNDVLSLVTEDLEELVRLGLPDTYGNPKLSYGNIKQRTLICLSTYFDSIFIELIPNPIFSYRWFLLILIFLFLFVVFLIMQYVFTIQVKRRQKIKDTLMRNQLAISKNQLEPHFMLNILNNIGYMFSKEDSKTGQYYFGKYTSLLHRGLKYADQVETTLQEELQFIKDYLVLQKMRLDDELEYNIEMEDDIEPELINIPHSLLYTFVENAVKHGLAPKESDRKLFIKITNTSKHTSIIIRDNGIGRTKSKEIPTTGTGKGLGIVADIIYAYNKLYDRSISYKVNDLFDDEGEAVGTEVQIII